MLISEIFRSIQGEGRNTGIPTTFIRFQGCNLNPPCAWCDTKYALRSGGGSDLEIDQVMEKVFGLVPEILREPLWVEGQHVCITGGEPLAFESDLHLLIERLYAERFYIEIFTNGSLPPPTWGATVNSWVVDVKCPSSKVTSPAWASWFVTEVDNQVKFVVANREDLEYVDSLRPDLKCFPEVLISPMVPIGYSLAHPDVITWMREVVEYCKKYNYRFSMQQHKLLYGDRRGV